MNIDLILILIAVFVIMFSVGLIVAPVYVWIIFLNMQVFLFRLIEKVFNFVEYKKEKSYYRIRLVWLKIEAKLFYYVTKLEDILFRLDLWFLDLLPDEIKTEMQPEESEMALRGIDAGRTYEYVAKAERTRADGSIIPLQEALAQAENEQYTVFEVKTRTAREAARERDEMLVMRIEKGSTVQNLKLGTLDFQLLLSHVTNIRRLLPPDGYCSYCGVDHAEAGHLTSDGYFDFHKMRAFARSRGRKGIYELEDILNHIDEETRAEVAAFIRNDGTEELGED